MAGDEQLAALQATVRAFRDAAKALANPAPGLLTHLAADDFVTGLAAELPLVHFAPLGALPGGMSSDPMLVGDEPGNVGQGLVPRRAAARQIDVGPRRTAGQRDGTFDRQGRAAPEAGGTSPQPPGVAVTDSVDQADLGSPRASPLPGARPSAQPDPGSAVPPGDDIAPPPVFSLRGRNEPPTRHVGPAAAPAAPRRPGRVPLRARAPESALAGRESARRRREGEQGGDPDPLVSRRASIAPPIRAAEAQRDALSGPAGTDSAIEGHERSAGPTAAASQAPGFEIPGIEGRIQPMALLDTLADAALHRAGSGGMAHRPLRTLPAAGERSPGDLLRAQVNVSPPGTESERLGQRASSQGAGPLEARARVARGRVPSMLDLLAEHPPSHRYPPLDAPAARGGASGPRMDADTLAALVNAALMEQARRHGVDLS